MGHRHFPPTSDYCCQPCSPALFAGIPLRVRLFALMLISVTLLGASGIAVASFPATLITLSRPTGRRPPPLSFPGPPVSVLRTSARPATAWARGLAEQRPRAGGACRPRLVPEQAKTQRTSGIGRSVNLRDTPFMPPIGPRGSPPAEIGRVPCCRNPHGRDSRALPRGSEEIASNLGGDSPRAPSFL